jgi:hypothetical protein
MGRIARGEPARPVVDGVTYTFFADFAHTQRRTPAFSQTTCALGAARTQGPTRIDLSWRNIAAVTIASSRSRLRCGHDR